MAEFEVFDDPRRFRDENRLGELVEPAGVTGRARPLDAADGAEIDLLAERALGAAEVTLFTDENYRPSNDLYRSLGFAPIAEFADFDVPPR